MRLLKWNVDFLDKYCVATLNNKKTLTDIVYKAINIIAFILIAKA